MIFFQQNYIAHATSWYDSKTLDDSTLLTRIVGKRINLIDMDREHFKLELAYLSPATARPDSARRNLKSCASTGEMKHALLRRRARQSCLFEDAQARRLAEFQAGRNFLYLADPLILPRLRESLRSQKRGR